MQPFKANKLKECEPGWLESFILPEVASSQPYTIDARPVHLKLDQNESSYDWPADLKAQICEQLKKQPWNRYPEAYSRNLEDKLAAFSGVEPENVIATPGSNLLLSNLLLLFARKIKGKVFCASPSFPLYQEACVTHSIAYENWFLTSEFEYDIEALRTLPSGSVVIFASPNNPTGNILPYESLQHLLSTHPDSLFIADEAYYEFSKKPYTELLRDFSNLILVRTFSKTMQAAGLRLGYVLANANIVHAIRKVTLPYMLNRFILLAASCLLDDSNALREMKNHIHEIIEEREKVYFQLSHIFSADYCKVYPSHANFFLLKFASQSICDAVFKDLVARGILLRNISKAQRLSGCLRMTIGALEENEELIRAFSEITKAQVA